jgi:hypothetical protein
MLARRVTSLPPAMRPIVSPVVLILSASVLARSQWLERKGTVRGYGVKQILSLKK